MPSSHQQPGSQSLKQSNWLRNKITTADTTNATTNHNDINLNSSIKTRSSVLKSFLYIKRFELQTAIAFLVMITLAYPILIYMEYATTIAHLALVTTDTTSSASSTSTQQHDTESDAAASTTYLQNWYDPFMKWHVLAMIGLDLGMFFGTFATSENFMYFDFNVPRWRWKSTSLQTVNFRKSWFQKSMNDHVSSSDKNQSYDNDSANTITLKFKLPRYAFAMIVKFIVRIIYITILFLTSTSKLSRALKQILIQISGWPGGYLICSTISFTHVPLPGRLGLCLKMSVATVGMESVFVWLPVAVMVMALAIDNLLGVFLKTFVSGVLMTSSKCRFICVLPLSHKVTTMG
jgi:hypothetical protein